MQLRVLGPLEIVDDNAVTIPVRGAQLRRALATLSLHAPASTPVDVLNDVLWPDGAPSPNALQALMSKLRKAIAPMTIDVSGSAYSLVMGSGEIDAHCFERSVTAGREAAAAGRLEEAVQHLDAALALWRDRPFEDIADLSVGQAPAARLMSLREAAISTRLECCISGGQIDTAAAELEALVVAEPLVERWWALLMVARYRQDRQADALRAFQQARTVLADELGLEPGPELRDLEAKVLRHDPSLGPSTRGTYSTPLSHRELSRRDLAHRDLAQRGSQLPRRLASFVGRAGHIDTLSELLGQARLVTVVGPGGAGKTSLAIEVGRRLSVGDDRPNVVLTELASVPRGGDVVGAVAALFGAGDADLRATTGTATDMDRIVDAIGSRPTLLVLDNCEHLIIEAASFVSTALRHCESLTILATSREQLAVAGEQVWSIPPLTPDESVELLAARAGSAGVGLEITASSAVRLIERLDGLPLAIELAAARLRSMTLDDLVDRLDDRFALLSVGQRSAEPRQQTLRNLVDWSHDLLDERERILFRRLAAFSGGATLEAIETVCADPVGQAGETRIGLRDVDTLVAKLVDKSLVIADHSASGVRFRMLQTLGDYASEQLIASGEAERVGQRHARYFAGQVAPAELGLMGHEQQRWMQWLRVEWANITTAMDHALAIDDADTAIQLVAPLGWYFFMIDETGVGVEWLRAALGCTGRTDPRLHSLALASCAFLAASGPDPINAAVVAERALETLDSYDDPVTEAFVTGMYVMCQLFRGHFGACREVFPLTESAALRSGNRWSIAMATLVGAELTSLLGQPQQAESEMRRAADGFAAVGDRFCYSICVAHAAELAEMRGDYDPAVRMLEESLAIAEDVGFSVRGLATRSRLANLETLRGNLALASSMHRQALASGTGPIPQWMHAMTMLGLANIARRRGDAAEAVRCVDEAMSLPRSQRIPLMHTSLLVARGYSADLAGDVETALSSQREALSIAVELGAARVTANAVEGLAGAMALCGDAETAARLLGAADALRRTAGGAMPAAERFDVDRAEGRARKTLGDQAFDAAFSAGASDPDLAIRDGGQRVVSV
jgi:predicted ATPase/DNA-binding SARP family transcriptional activator